MPDHSIWTREAVERRLIAAFRASPAARVYRPGMAPVSGSAGAIAGGEALGWAVLLPHDPQGRLMLWCWARCRATGASYGETCREMGWSRNRAELGRRRAAAAIAAGLRAADAALDMGKAAAGP